MNCQFFCHEDKKSQINIFNILTIHSNSSLTSKEIMDNWVQQKMIIILKKNTRNGFLCLCERAGHKTH